MASNASVQKMINYFQSGALKLHLISKNNIPTPHISKFATDKQKNALNVMK
jgi:hypothetical protein